MSTLFRNLFFSLICLAAVQIHSQSETTDSLERLLKRTQIDTQKVHILQELCRQYLFSDSRKALTYGHQSLILSSEINYQKGSAKALHNIGIVYYNISNYDSALYYFGNSLKLKKQIGDKKGMASSLNNIGAIEALRGRLSKATNYYIQSLKINEELGNDEGALSAAINIGNILSDQYNYKGAEKYYRIGLEFAKKANNNKGIADAYHNIGIAKNDLSQEDSALIYYLKAHQLYEAGSMTERLGSSFILLGEWNYKHHKIDSALTCFEKAKKFCEETENQEGLSNAYQHLGKIYLIKRDYQRAEKFLIDGLAIAKQLGIREYESVFYENLAELGAKQGDFSKAYHYQLLYTAIKDSLITEESLKQVADMNVKYESEKKEQQISLLNKDKELQDVNLKKQRLIIIVVIGGFLMAVALLLVIFKTLKITQKKNAIISEQSKLVEEKSQMLEQKNRDILDSINYAKRIQDALLKEEEHVSAHLPEHFILYKPKDIVSGDFYWAIEKDDYWYLAVADCTGHGVPGAFMSMLGIAFLNEISAITGNLTPAQILDSLRDKIVKELGQKGNDGESRDGMDISLVRYHRKQREIQWAGANNSIYIVRGDVLSETKGNKQPIGYHPEMLPFTNYSFTLGVGDSFYLSTDGFADQFGGSAGKKYKYSRFKDLLIQVSNHSMEKQKELLQKEFEAWKESYEQTDDLCLMGIRV